MFAEETSNKVEKVPTVDFFCIDDGIVIVHRCA